MAKAISNIKRVKVQGSITLTLTPEEAIYLKALVANTVEYDCNGCMVMGGYKTAEKYSVAIWDALTNTGVPCANNVLADNAMKVVSDISLVMIENAMDKF